MSSNGDSTRNVNFVLKLYRGDFSLPITYWLFGGIGGVLIRLVMEIYEYNYAKITRSESIGFEVALLLFFIIAIAYSLLMFIAIWRSAGKYKDSSLWSGLARFMVVLGVLAFIGESIALFNQGNNSTVSIRDEFEAMNKNLPIMLDDVTRLDHVSLQDKDIYYDYTIIDAIEQGPSADDIDKFKSIFDLQ